MAIALTEYEVRIHCREVMRSQDNDNATIYRQQFAASLPSGLLLSNATRTGERITGAREGFDGFRTALSVAATSMVLFAKSSIRKLNCILRQVRKTDLED
jgi:hypothetical protein